MSAVTCLPAAPFGEPRISRPAEFLSHRSSNLASRTNQPLLSRSRQPEKFYNLGRDQSPPTKAMTGIHVIHQTFSYPSGPAPHQPTIAAEAYRPFDSGSLPTAHTYSRPTNASSASSDPSHSTSHEWPRQSNAPSAADTADTADTTPSRQAVATHLHVPTSINHDGGSLAEFAAEMTCLFWFESTSIIRRGEEFNPLTNDSVPPLATDTLPTAGFLKWVSTIWSTTQVTQNVLLLALLFIHRLKSFNPSVSGKKGSEYRLLTVALMLANKFLDDNTYTNKTWAEVSGISVSEVHVMEVEFLSNMRYDLYVSDWEWEGWLAKLGRLSKYFARATTGAAFVDPSTSAPAIPPFSHTFPHDLWASSSPGPYPPAIQQATLPHPTATSLQISPSPQPSFPPPEPLRGRRKRSYDDDVEVPYAKRLNLGRSYSQSPSTASVGQAVPYFPAHSFPTTSPLLPPNHPASHPQPRPPHVASLPTPSGHPMPDLRPRDGGQLPVPISSSTSLGPWPQSTLPGRTLAPPNLNLFTHHIPNLGPPSGSRYGAGGSGSSPLSYGASTPSQRSPMSVLEHRDSPYRPVRAVNTLLIPPPSTSFPHPSRHIAHDRMRYQPLGKTLNEARSGVVPSLPHNTWSHMWPGPPAQFASSSAVHSGGQ